MAFALRAHFVRPNGIPPFCEAHSGDSVTISQLFLAVIPAAQQTALDQERDHQLRIHTEEAFLQAQKVL